MKKLIFLDDVRVVEDVTWLDYNQLFSSVTVLRSYQEFKEWCDKLCSSSDLSTYVFSFDHDIDSYEREEEFTGYDAAKYLVEKVLELNLQPTFSWYVHSMNPVGRVNINSYLQNFIKHMSTPNAYNY